MDRTETMTAEPTDQLSQTDLDQLLADCRTGEVAGDGYKYSYFATVQVRRLLNAHDALRKELDEAREQIAYHSDFLAFMHGELKKWPCRCGPAGDTAHDATPPCNWPEWIGCIIQQDRIDKLGDAGVAAQAELLAKRAEK